SFQSRVFDASAPVDWHSIQWTATPAGGSVSISVRTGNTPTPDATWSAFAPVAVPGPLALTSQFIQYRAVLTSPDPTATPALEDIIISTGHAPIAVDDSATVPENGSHTFPPSGPGSLTDNDTDADPTDTLHVLSVTPPAHGSASLAASGAVIYTPTPTYSGPDAFTYTVTDGLMTASATVSLDVRFGNIAPVANNDFYTGTEDTTLVVPAASGILANDTDVEHDALSAVLVTLPAHGQLTLSASGGFSYVPVLNYAGPDVFTYKANDGTSDGNVATVTIQILQVNDPPITEADTFTAVLNQTLDVPAPGVLRNDHDVEVEDTVPMHAQLVSGTTHGQLIFRPDGSFSYVPDANYLGIDSFTYAAVDHFNAVGNTNTVTLTVATKAVSAVVPGGGTVATGTDVSAADPLQSAVTSPANGTVAIAQGVISASQPPAGYTFLNQQVNISVTGADGAEVTAQGANPIRLRFTIDRSLIPAGQDY
ncbi:MAG TPA: Ig-like domain-containing protein, partial [Mycobacteriales bacterium]|nr:Ig-like domain-containing protein [Mycobacteriales bacterium]